MFDVEFILNKWKNDVEFILNKWNNTGQNENFALSATIRTDKEFPLGLNSDADGQFERNSFQTALAY